jgi:hypothetical protein
MFNLFKKDTKPLTIHDEYDLLLTELVNKACDIVKKSGKDFSHVEVHNTKSEYTDYIWRDENITIKIRLIEWENTGYVSSICFHDNTVHFDDTTICKPLLELFIDMKEEYDTIQRKLQAEKSLVLKQSKIENVRKVLSQLKVDI